MSGGSPACGRSFLHHHQVQSLNQRGQDMDARNDMLRLLNGRRQGFSLEQPFYTDPDYFKLDMELIWYRDWLFIGHDCELPKPGSYITVQIGDYPVVLVRDQKGNINAFHNSCRHRGSRVCNTEQGHGGKARLPLSPVDLRARRPAAVRPPDGRRFRQEPVRPEAGRLRERRRLHLHLPGQGARRFRADARDDRALPHAAPAAAKPRSPSRARSSRRATGSWSGKTTASAITAPATIRSCARPSRKRRR